MNERLFASQNTTRYEPRASLTLEDIRRMTQQQLLDTFTGAKAAFTQLRDWSAEAEAQMERAS